MTVLFLGERHHLTEDGTTTLCGMNKLNMVKRETKNTPDNNGFIWENDGIGIWICRDCMAKYNPTSN